MRSPARLVTGTAAAALSAVALGLATAAPPAYAGDLGKLEFAPASAAPGTSVTVSTTACGPDGAGIGDANDLGAGDFDLKPGTHKEVVTGRFTVPQGTESGTYVVAVSCDDGKEATGDLEVTAGSGSAASAGWPKPEETVEPTASSGWPRPEPEPRPTRPSGHVGTGVGGSVGPDTAQIAAGVGVLGAAALGGAWLLRRRSNGSQDS
ncbi:hypothetical protein [Streptomyces sp. NPDC060035]|uniref:hypothetical protein n=1 Tax=Streptomyces sp. NPDC060035 TaxID=3347044 RepID=UPI0036844DAC